MGGRPVPSISLPPCTTSVCSAIISFPPWFRSADWPGIALLASHAFSDPCNGLDRQDRHQLQFASRFDFHVPGANLFVGPSAPNDVACRAVEIRQIIERHERHVLHENLSCLLEESNPLFVIRSALLLFDQLVELRIAVGHWLRGPGPKVLVVESVGVDQAASADIVKRQVSRR